jgi:aspartyl-tRNA(Asn)/glutamyl-tRNA(Gln) amidotransferase subunit A
MKDFAAKGEVLRRESEIPHGPRVERFDIWDDASVIESRDFNIMGLIHAYYDGVTTATQIVERCLDRIAETDGEIGAWAFVSPDAALAEARARDDERRAGTPMKFLHGIPVGIKDVIDVAGMPTTAGAPPFAHSHPTRDAPLVARLRAMGAVIVGKTVATPFAYLDPAGTRNPLALDHTPGGSSSGSAAAVAARHVPGAIGTQTIGSILRPAAFCGVVGLKGNHGDVPMDGVFPLAPSLDHVGALASRVYEVAMVQRALSGQTTGVPDVEAPRLAAPPELFDRAEPALRAHLDDLVARFEDAGAVVVREPVPFPLDEVLQAGMTVLEMEAAAQHRALFAKHAEEYPPMIRGLVEVGLGRPPEDLASAQLVRMAFRQAVGPWLAGFDALVSPVAPGPAPLLGAGTGDPSLCGPWTYAGIPAISIPTGLDDDGLPLAIQLVGPRAGMDPLLGAAAWCERVVRFWDVSRPYHRQ